jgi:hypothetical protein
MEIVLHDLRSMTSKQEMTTLMSSVSKRICTLYTSFTREESAINDFWIYIKYNGVFVGHCYVDTVFEGSIEDGKNPDYLEVTVLCSFQLEIKTLLKLKRSELVFINAAFGGSSIGTKKTLANIIVEKAKPILKMLKIGSTLMCEVEDLAVTLGVPHIYLYATSEAMSFYWNLGYRYLLENGCIDKSLDSLATKVFSRYLHYKGKSTETYTSGKGLIMELANKGYSKYLNKVKQEFIRNYNHKNPLRIFKLITRNGILMSKIIEISTKIQDEDQVRAHSKACKANSKSPTRSGKQINNYIRKVTFDGIPSCRV